MEYFAAGPPFGVMGCDGMLSFQRGKSGLRCSWPVSTRQSPATKDLMPPVRDIEAARRQAITVWQYDTKASVPPP